MLNFHESILNDVVKKQHIKSKLSEDMRKVHVSKDTFKIISFALHRRRAAASFAPLSLRVPQILQTCPCFLSLQASQTYEVYPCSISPFPNWVLCRSHELFKPCFLSLFLCRCRKFSRAAPAPFPSLSLQVSQSLANVQSINISL